VSLAINAAGGLWPGANEPAQVLVADPPWKFGDSLPGATRGASRNYKVLGIDEICRFSLPPIADNAVLFLWRVSSQPEEALRVVRAWGFCPKTELVWVKKTVKDKQFFGMGRYTRAAHETCIIAVRGTCPPRVRNVRSTFEAKVGQHSEKPDEFYKIVESLYEGPRVELYARRRRDGWACFGDELPPEAAGDSIESPPSSLQ